MLAGLSNCCGIHAPGVLRNQLLGALDRARHPYRARRQFELSAIGEHQSAPLDRHAVGHHQDQSDNL